MYTIGNDVKIKIINFHNVFNYQKCINQLFKFYLEVIFLIKVDQRLMFLKFVILGIIIQYFYVLSILVKCSHNINDVKIITKLLSIIIYKCNAGLKIKIKCTCMKLYFNWQKLK